MFDLGGNVSLQITLYGPDGVTPTNAASVVLTVTLPDQSTTTPAVANPSTGVYTATGPSSTGGRYGVRWVTNNPTDAITDQYDVRDSVSIALLSLADARAALNMTKTVNDGELRLYIDATTALIEGEIGAVLPRTVSETVEIWRDFFITRQPIISLTSLTPVRTGGMTLNASDYQVLSTGKVIRKDGAWVSISPWNQYTAVFQAGRTSIDSRIFQAARVLLQHLWLNQRGTAPTRDADAYTVPFTMPNSVREALSKLQTLGIG